MKKILISLLFAMVSFTSAAQAAGGGGHSIGLGFISASPGQDDINSWVDSVGAAGTKNLGSAYEIPLFYAYRFSGSIFALQVRPSYFTQSSSGGGVDAGLSGFTFFPLLRLYPLENNFIKFFLQAGVGYGSLSGSLKNAATGGEVSFSGGAFGGLAGLGAEFCFTPSHCMSIEGNLRYLPIPRNLISSSNGTNLGGSMATNATTKDYELEFGANPDTDMKTTLSGFLAAINYIMYF